MESFAYKNQSQNTFFNILRIWRKIFLFRKYHSGRQARIGIIRNFLQLCWTEAIVFLLPERRVDGICNSVPCMSRHSGFFDNYFKLFQIHTSNVEVIDRNLQTSRWHLLVEICIFLFFRLPGLKPQR